MKKENPQRRKVGRKPKAKPEKYRYVVRMDEDENRQFKLMFQKSEAVHHSKFIKSVLLNRTIKIIKDRSCDDGFLHPAHQFLSPVPGDWQQLQPSGKSRKDQFRGQEGLRAAPQIGEGDRRTCDSEPPDSGSHQRVQGEVS